MELGVIVVGVGIVAVACVYRLRHPSGRSAGDAPRDTRLPPIPSAGPEREPWESAARTTQPLALRPEPVGSIARGRVAPAPTVVQDVPTELPDVAQVVVAFDDAPLAPAPLETTPLEVVVVELEDVSPRPGPATDAVAELRAHFAGLRASGSLAAVEE